MLADLQLDGNQFVVQLHHPNNCDLAILPRELDLGSAYGSRDDSGNPIIYAHIKPKEKLSHATAALKAAGNLPGATSTDGSSLNQATSPAAHKGESNETGTKIQKGPVEHFHYVRIGTQECDKDTRNKAVQLEIFLVAEIPQEAHRDTYGAITFRSVNTWNIGGVQLGHCENGTELDITEMPASCKLDPAFITEPDKRAITALLYNIADDVADYQLVSGLSTQREKSDNNQKTIEIVQAPKIPTYAAYDAEPALVRNDRRASIVTLVVDFKNSIDDQDLGIASNFQVELHHNETYANFEEFILEGDEAFEGLKKNTVLSKLQFGFQLECWVLPQIAGSSEMYSWTRLRHWKACDWLDHDIVVQFSRNLYVEVHILPARSGDGIGPLELEDEIAAARRNRVVGVIEEEGGKIPGARRPSKRVTQADLDEDYEEGSVLAADGTFMRKKGKGRKK